VISDIALEFGNIGSYDHNYLITIRLRRSLPVVRQTRIPFHRIQTQDGQRLTGPFGHLEPRWPTFSGGHWPSWAMHRRPL